MNKLITTICACAFFFQSCHEQMKNQPRITYMSDSVIRVEEVDEKGQVLIQQHFDESKELNGKSTEWDSLGRIVNILNFKHGENEGTQYFYYPNGVVSFQEDYVNGKKEGQLIARDEDGRIIAHEYYKGDKLVKAKFIKDENNLSNRIKLYIKSGVDSAAAVQMVNEEFIKDSLAGNK